MSETEVFAEIAKGAGLGMIALAALLILGRVVARIGERMIQAIDKVSTRIDEHSKEDIGAIGDLSERIARLEGKIDIAMEFTPVENARARRAKSEPGGARSGYYGPRKPPRGDGKE